MRVNIFDLLCIFIKCTIFNSSTCSLNHLFRIIICHLFIVWTVCCFNRILFYMFTSVIDDLISIRSTGVFKILFNINQFLWWKKRKQAFMTFILEIMIFKNTLISSKMALFTYTFQLISYVVFCVLAFNFTIFKWVKNPISIFLFFLRISFIAWNLYPTLPQWGFLFNKI